MGQYRGGTSGSFDELGSILSVQNLHGHEHYEPNINNLSY